MNNNLISGLKTLSNFFRHPVILLLIGSVITSYLLPLILSEAARQESDRKEKLSIAFKFLNRNAEMNQNFNSLLVSLELFHKYSSPKYLDEEQKELRKTSKELYMKFNANAWEWHWDLYEEAKIWKLLPESEDKYVKSALTRYTKGWTNVLKKLSNFWDTCLDDNYKVRDTSVTRLMNETREELHNSVALRDSAIRFIVSKFDIEEIKGNN